MCVFSYFLAEFVRSLANCCVYKEEMTKKIIWRRSKCIFRNRFYLQHGILGLLLVLQDSWKGCEY